MTNQLSKRQIQRLTSEARDLIIQLRMARQAERRLQEITDHLASAGFDSYIGKHWSIHLEDNFSDNEVIHRSTRIYRYQLGHDLNPAYFDNLRNKDDSHE